MTQPKPHHEILQDLRASLEAEHNTQLVMQNGWHRMRFSLEIMTEPPNLDLKTAAQCCNKTAPIYIICEDGTSVKWLLCSILQYVYRSWFRPYQTDIEYRQFLVQLFTPTKVPRIDSTSLSAIADLAKGMSAALCSRVDRFKQLAQSLTGHELREKLDKSESNKNRIDAQTEHLVLHQEHYILQPLFQAIAIVVTEPKFDMEQLPVVIVLTGVQDGLNAPITFDTIEDKIENRLVGPTGVTGAVKTTLETAIGFLMELENREVNAFGPKPDPDSYAEDYLSDWWNASIARRYGWAESMGPLFTPSSSWVDQTIYPSETGWSGNLMNGMIGFEERERFSLAMKRKEHTQRLNGAP